ncbi:MAG: hypothetical protein QOE14_3111 [Humisphaera sp.]|nr:hypothetical protein [Humisphaera sp.]
MQGNKIGTDATGMRKIANATDGVYVGSAQNQIGGRARGTGNLIAGNGGDGIRVNNSGGNLISRNVIGADGTGASALANAKNGILLVNSNASSIRDNTIAFNGGHGVQVATGNDNAIVSNSIHSNVGLAINLGWDGANKNDATDSDAGANGLQNYPIVASALRTATGTRLAGTITSKAGTTLYVEFFSEGGRTLVGSVFVTTNASGVATFSLPIALVLPVGTSIVSTATSPTGSTSEFSPATTVK